MDGKRIDVENMTEAEAAERLTHLAIRVSSLDPNTEEWRDLYDEVARIEERFMPLERRLCALECDHGGACTLPWDHQGNHEAWGYGIPNQVALAMILTGQDPPRVHRCSWPQVRPSPESEG